MSDLEQDVKEIVAVWQKLSPQEREEVLAFFKESLMPIVGQVAAASAGVLQTFHDHGFRFSFWSPVGESK